MVRPRSPHLLALITVPLSVRVSAGGGKIVRGEDRFDPGHGERRVRMDTLDPRMRHWAEEQFAEQHAFCAKVLGVFCLAGNLRIEIRRHIVLADQLVPAPYWRADVCVLPIPFLLSMLRPSQILCAAHQRGQNLVVVLAAAQVARHALRQFLARGIGIGFQESHCSHDEAGHDKTRTGNPVRR